MYHKHSRDFIERNLHDVFIVIGSWCLAGLVSFTPVFKSLETTLFSDSELKSKPQGIIHVNKAVLVTTVSVLLVGLLASAFDLRVSGMCSSEITVPDEYQTIQEAINNALDWDTVYVRSGVYYENVVVNKTVSLVGEDLRTTIVNGNGTGTVITVISDNINITGLTIQRSGSTDDDAGIDLLNVSDCRISGTNITNCHWGICLASPSRNNSISGNNITNDYCGILVVTSHNNTLSQNYIADNYGAIEVTHYSSDNRICGNNVTNNEYGIGFWLSDSNSVSENIVTNNVHGILVTFSRHNEIYHNIFVDNGEQASASSGYANRWDYDYPFGGNFWSDYAGADLYGGSFQDITGSDGIGDAQYIISDDNIDRYPLMVPWIPEFPETDLNDDGTVNIVDIAIVAIAFGSQGGDEHYNVLADLDENNEVNILDISIVAMDYGKTV
jgi:parallel beta-helix repeat protein